jgi:hypothetical protein
MGQVLIQRGEQGAAVRKLTEVLQLCRDGGDAVGEGYLLLDLGNVLAEVGRTAEAKRFFSQALVLRERLTDPAGAAVARFYLARLLAATGEKLTPTPYKNKRCPPSPTGG